MRKLRILFAGYLPPHRGGSATAHSVILKLLASRGHSIRAIAHITSADSADDWFAGANPSLHVRRFEVPYYLSVTSTPLPSELAARRATLESIICDECAKDKPDVLLLGNTAFSVAQYQPGQDQPERSKPELAGIPTAMFVHGGALHKLQQKQDSAAELADHLNRYLNTDHLIAVAAHLSPQLEELGLTRHSVILNTTDTQEFRPRQKSAALAGELGIAADDVVVAHFSNLKYVKRPLDFVAAAGIALARNPHLLFLAGGEGELRQAMEERCAQLGITERFRFPGWIRSDRMPEYYSVCDMVVMPSQSEARSMVFLETQASGRLLIASDIPASRDAIQDGVTGLLFPVGSTGVLAEHILTAAAKPALRETIGRRARAAAEERSQAACGEEFERVLSALVERGPHRPVV